MITLISRAQFNLVGNAQIQPGDCIQLTASQPFQMGALWFAQQVDLRKDLDIRARLYLGNNLGAGADGMAFVLQRQSTNAGSSGEGLGYQGITPSIIVELDTYQNNNLGDPNNRHMALMANGNPNHNNALTPPVFILDGGWPADNLTFINFRFTYTAATNRIRVYTNCNLRIDYSGDILNNIFSGQPLVYWGFTGATGGLTNQQQVCNIYNSQLTNLRHTDTLCMGDSLRLFAPFVPNSVYQWSPSADLDRTDIANPLCVAKVSRQYIATITDTCYGLVIRDTFDVIVPPAIPHTVSRDSPVCSGSVISLEVRPVRPALSYLWISPDGTRYPEPAIRPVALAGGYRSEVRSGKCIVFRSATQVDPLPSPPADITGRLQYCAGDTILLSGPGGLTYTWQTPGNTNGASTQALLFTALPAEAGPYILKTGHGINNCTGADTAEVVISARAVAQIAETFLPVCELTTGKINVVATSPYRWSPASWVTQNTLPVTGVSNPQDGWLVLRSSTGPGCSAADSIFLKRFKIPRIEAGPNVTLFEDQVLELRALATGDSLLLKWLSPAQNVLGNTNTINVMQPAAGRYTFQVQSQAGCGTATDTLYVNILKRLVIPNSFSPNGDGINDRWFIQHLDTYQRTMVSIYNREGQLLYQGRMPVQGWDGQYKGKLLPPATYYYLLEGTLLPSPLSGWIQLFR